MAASSCKSSKSSIYESLKSSSSKFGSCLSTTDTIGSFRTAFSGSLSTLYYSAKGDEESLNTLNWTMNYHSFDELSDTSTLVDANERLHNSVSDQTLHDEEENLAMPENLAKQNSIEISLVNSKIYEEPSGKAPIESSSTLTIESKTPTIRQTKSSKFSKVFSSGTGKFLLVLISSVSSVGVHLLLSKVRSTSNWSLVFWKSLFQLLICSPFLWKTQLVSRYNLITACLHFLSLMFWLDISHKNLLSQERCSTFYCILPLVLFALEMLFGRKKAQFNWTYSGLLCLSWTLATVAFSWPNSVFKWDFIIQDPIFSWPILIPSQAHTEQPLGHVLATFAIVTSSASFFVYSLDKSHSWSLFLFWQAIGGLLAASLGLASVEGWPKWPQELWWFPLTLSLLGIFANVILVKLIFSSEKYSSFLFVKVSLEALVLLFAHCSVQIQEVNVILASLFFLASLVILYFME